METNNKKKDDLLGEPYGTANGKLRKEILFRLLKELNKNVCFQCGKEIETVSELSIEHKNPWMSAENPVEAFYDMNNIAFSHLKCNCSASSRKNHPYLSCRGENNRMSKLKESDVLEILDLYYNKNVKPTELCKIYNIGRRQITYVVSGECWKDVYNDFKNTEK